MDNREQVFQQVFDEILDYLPDFKRRATGWGEKTYDLIEREEKVVVSDRDEYPVEFTYALTLAVIVGEFGQFGYGGHFLTEMALPDREIAVMGGKTPLATFHEAIWERKEDIYRALNDIYTSRHLDPVPEVYASLVALFENEPDADRAVGAFAYVDRGFTY